MVITVNDVTAWLPVIMQLAALGVRSFNAIEAAMQDAGADEATITAMEAKWDALVADVRRAAGPI
jgi:hypothetical protein